MDRLDYYFRQKVTEAELDLGFNNAERADRALTTDYALTGVAQGAVVSQKSGTPNLTVDVTGPASIYDKLGQRIFFASLQNVNVAVDENGTTTSVTTPGNSKKLAIFAKFKRLLSDPRTDGNSLTVNFKSDESFEFKVRQSAEGVSPSLPALDAEYILLADITRTNGQTQILNADISTTRREDMFVQVGTTKTLRRGTAKTALADIVDWYNGHVSSSSPADQHSATAITASIAATFFGAVAVVGTNVDAVIENIVSQLADSAGSDSGAHKIGCEARTAWLGGRTNPSGVSVFAAIDKIITDLNAQTANDDGAERIGAEAIAGSPNSLVAGSARSQLTALLGFANACARKASTEAITGAWTFDNITVSGTNRYKHESQVFQRTIKLVPTFPNATPWNCLDGYIESISMGVEIYFELDLPDGVDLDEVGLILEGNGHVGMPIAKPQLSIFRVDTSGVKTAVGAPATDPETLQPNYDAPHPIAVVIAGTHTVDRSEYRYYAKLVGENGLNAANDGLRIHSGFCTWTSTASDPAAS